MSSNLTASARILKKRPLVGAFLLSLTSQFIVGPMGGVYPALLLALQYDYGFSSIHTLGSLAAVGLSGCRSFWFELSRVSGARASVFFASSLSGCPPFGFGNRWVGALFEVTACGVGCSARRLGGGHVDLGVNLIRPRENRRMGGIGATFVGLVSSRYTGVFALGLLAKCGAECGFCVFVHPTAGCHLAPFLSAR